MKGKYNKLTFQKKYKRYKFKSKNNSMKKNYILIILLTIIFSTSCYKHEKLSNDDILINMSSTLLEENLDFTISQEEAKTFALNFFNNHVKNTPSLKIKSSNSFLLPFENKKLFLFRFEPEGFILLSDDKRNIPIFAFSEKDDFNFTKYSDLPSGVREWLSEFVLINRKLETNSELRDYNRIGNKWSSILNDDISTKIVDPYECEVYYLNTVQNIYDDCILETNWSQNLPYNLLTPICSETGENTPTGCIATAMAQVMNYWQYPNNYDWSILQNYYLNSDISSSAYEVANLMSDIGDAVNMDYNCTSSGATSTAAKNALKDDFNYNSDIAFEDYDISYIRGNLRSNYPVILGGYRTVNSCCGITWYSNGHSWVTDGLWEVLDNYKEICYSASGIPMDSYYTLYSYYLHMNWGCGLAPY